MSGHDFRYEIGGGLIPVESIGESDSIADNMALAGYDQIVEANEDGEVDFVVWRLGELNQWVIEVRFGSACLIQVDGWPAMMDAMTRYAGVFQAAGWRPAQVAIKENLTEIYDLLEKPRAKLNRS